MKPGLFVCVVLLGGGCAADRGAKEPVSIPGFTPSQARIVLSMSPLPPVPPDPTNRVADDPRAAALGQAIFFDTRFSRSGDVSCATCHDPTRGWADAQSVPTRFDPEGRTVPSLWNVAFNRWYFWDGRADSLWSQALGPLENRKEHAGDRAQYAGVVTSDTSLSAAYQRIFGAAPSTASPDSIDGVFVNLGKAIAAYERRLVSRRAPFDIYVEGVRNADPERIAALSQSAARGLGLFVGKAGCSSCHNGANFTDNEFHDTGIASFDAVDHRDQGRLAGVTLLLASPFNAMGPYNDNPGGRSAHPTSFLVNNTGWRGQFKTPTLRNVEVTAPYMHRGQLGTLEDVVSFYSELHPPGVDPIEAAARRDQADRARRAAGGVEPPSHVHAHQGRDPMLRRLGLSPEESADLVAFLRSLTDTAIDPALTRPLTPEQLLDAMR